ncbi:hypothetical protein AO398_02500 [Methylobacterium sp. GXS13]|uniref:hypothetical protein n=1 Tax=Methylobacterium sp. GXS13 TaxID=1730094 RepID=UPI00071BC909|nr:hypothetical protein [Methylobacterium sp. GXS13]KST61738.1 hypothetical protein AO398_02500 [Methylobacterium sp. GXS13]
MRSFSSVFVLAGLILAGSPDSARAQSRTTLGVGSGAVAGALVAGPIGAVAGAVVGGFVGNSTERGRRHVRRRRHTSSLHRAPQRRAEAQLARATGTVARTAPPAATAWKDPH